MTEIRSYRRVFDLERRIYSIEQIRLNPSGVPVRGVIYLLAAVVASIFSARLPGIGMPLRGIPWFLRDLAFPAAIAAALTVIRIDGRTFHHAARAAVSFWVAPRRTVGLRLRAQTGARWRPSEVFFLPDGEEADVRRCRYRGPGTVAILVRHRCCPTERRGLPRPRRHREVTLLAVPSAGRLRRPRVIELDGQTSLLVDRDHGRKRQ